jgi:hypothetical protein
MNLFSALHDLEDMCTEYGIPDLLQDNGAKVLQQLVLLNFDNLPGREGNDAVSASGTEWEMKSINIATSASGFSTNHHTTYDIIRKYRSVPWSFAIYDGIRLLSIYVMTPEQLEPLFSHWEEKLRTMPHLNNPKIPVKFVQEKGLLVYPYDRTPIDPDSINYY